MNGNATDLESNRTATDSEILALRAKFGSRRSIGGQPIFDDSESFPDNPSSLMVLVNLASAQLQGDYPFVEVTGSARQYLIDRAVQHREQIKEALLSSPLEPGDFRNAAYEQLLFALQEKRKVMNPVSRGLTVAALGVASAASAVSIVSYLPLLGLVSKFPISLISRFFLSVIKLEADDVERSMKRICWFVGWC